MKKCDNCAWKYDCEHQKNLLWAELAGEQNLNHAGFYPEQKTKILLKYYANEPVIYKTPPRASFNPD